MKSKTGSMMPRKSYQRKNFRKMTVSWAAYRATQTLLSNHEPAIISLLPLFTENAHSLAMTAHSMRVIRAAVVHVNPSLCMVTPLSMTAVIAVDSRCLPWIRKFSGGLVVFMTKIGLFLCLAGFTWKWRPGKCSASGSLALDGQKQFALLEW